MYALCDGNSFYANSEKVFDPTLRKKPVVVLSNNDGFIVAACGIAKQMGMAYKFKPYFQIKKELDEAGVVPKSSNYALYADLSNKMMDTCARFAKESYIYSIDECFLDFDDFYTETNTPQWEEIGNLIRRTVWREVRLPIGVGIGSTPTLAKAANHASKRIKGYNGVAVINDEKSRRHILSQMALTDVWGIGSKLGKRLEDLGYRTAWDLSNANPQKIRKGFSILVENTVRELNGEIRLRWDEQRAAKKEIYSSRSFGERVICKEELRISLINHAEVVAKKLRDQKSLTKALTVFASNSPHDDERPYSKHVLVKLEMPSCDTRLIANRVSNALEEIFKLGIKFYKSGVGAMDISPADGQQQDMFCESEDDNGLMMCLDKINARYGSGTLHLAAKGFFQSSAMKRNYLSPQYTTNWAHIPIIKCN
jgi:DNA polymerase V